MSLDLYLNSKKPIKHKRGEAQGNYSEIGGGFTRALSYEEVKALWPDTELPYDSNEEYEDNEYYWANITHNLAKMASHCPCLDGKSDLYKLMWHPNENGFKYVNEEYQKGIEEGLIYLLTHKEELEQYNPPIDPETGKRWGEYITLVDFTKAYLIALSSYPYKEDELEIYAST
jgi:hypothetical protein